MTALRVGDIVEVEPRTALLNRPAPGGRGVVTESFSVDGERTYVEVLLDSGDRRHPFVEQCTLVKAAPAPEPGYELCPDASNGTCPWCARKVGGCPGSYWRERGIHPSDADSAIAWPIQGVSEAEVVGEDE